MPISEDLEVTVDLAYSNLTERWYASFLDMDGDVVVYATAATRADALRNLADEMDEYEQ